MASKTEILPEGADTILPGAIAVDAPDADFAKPSRGRATAKKIEATVEEKTAGVRGQATDKAREFATQGKEKATSGLDGVVKLIDGAAGTIDEKIGEQYGAYARRASESLSGLADTLRSKDVDELFTDAREAVRRNPAIAIGAAAAVGFVIARIVKSAPGSDKDEQA